MKTFSISAFALLVAAAPVAHAQFGGIVLDPTQSAHAVVQIGNEEQSLANDATKIEQGTQLFTTTVKMAATALQTYNTVTQQYNLYHEMILAPTILYSRFLSPTSDLMLMQQVSNHYNNTAGFVSSANTGSGASAAYLQTTVPNVTATITASSVAGQQEIAAQGATVDLGDSIAATNLQALGTIRANQTARQADIANLEAETASQDPSQLTQMAVLMRINQALLLILRSQQDQSQMQSNSGMQQILMQKQQQDSLKAAFRDGSTYQQTYNGTMAATSGASILLTQAF